MKKIALLSVALLLMLACTAVAPDVVYNFDEAADFSRFRTYKWVSMRDAPSIDDLRDKQIKDAVDVELARKGLNKTDAENADLYLGYQLGVGTETQITSYKTNWGYGPGWAGGTWHRSVGGMTTGQFSTLYFGQLALDMYDSKNHSLAWRGIASKTIDPKAKPDKQQKNLGKAVATLLKNYPPPPPKAESGCMGPVTGTVDSVLFRTPLLDSPRIGKPQPCEIWVIFAVITMP